MHWKQEASGIALIAILICYACSAHAKPDLSLLDELVRQEMQSSNIPGISLTIFTSDQIVYHGNYGDASPSGIAVTSETPFVIGSLSKYITAFVIMQLVDEGRIVLDAPAATYLPWFQPSGRHAVTPITSRQLMHHTSGMPAIEGIDFRADYAELSLEEMCRIHATAKLNRPIGKSYEYSNANYNLLGCVVEAITGQPFGKVVSTNLFDPIGMKHSHTSLASAARDGLAVGHHAWFQQAVPVTDYPYVDGFLPSMTIMSSSEDIARLVMATQSNMLPDGGSMLSPAVWEAWRRPDPAGAELDGFLGNYGSGYLATAIADHPTVFVQGGYSTFRAYIFYMPGDDVGMAILMNKNTLLADGGLTSIPRAIAHRLIGESLATESSDRAYWLFVAASIAIALLIVVHLARTLKNKKKMNRDRRSLLRSCLPPMMLDGAIIFGLLVGLPAAVGIPTTTMMFVQPDLTWMVYALSVLAAFSLAIRFIRLCFDLSAR